MRAPPSKWAREQWNVGDEAFVVHQFSEPAPKKGTSIRVDGVYPHPWDSRVIGLSFNAFPLEVFNSNGFVKIPPLTRHERDEFLTDLEFDMEVANGIAGYGKVKR